MSDDQDESPAASGDTAGVPKTDEGTTPGPAAPAPPPAYHPPPAPPPNPFTPVVKQPWIAPNRKWHVAGVGAALGLLLFLIGAHVGNHWGNDHHGPGRGEIVINGPGPFGKHPGEMRDRLEKMRPERPTVTVTVTPSPTATR